MKKIYLLVTFFSTISNADNLQLTVSSTNHTKMPLTILLSHTECDISQKVVATIKKDLIFTDQFTPKVHAIDATISKKELARTMKKLSSKGIPLALYLDTTSDTINWRLYDTLQGTKIKGKKYKPQGAVVRAWGHAIADEIVNALTGNESFFSSRIVYCKELKTDNNKAIKHIYIADYDGSNKELLVDVPAITVAPRWNGKTHNPAIFYSEYTDTNVQLMSVDMHKNKNVASNLDGINMLVDFSPNGEKSIFCASQGKGNCQLYCQTKNNLRPLTSNNGNNFSPVFMDNDRICFCSDAQMKIPQIYIGDLETGHIQRITNGGYCTSPSYCKKRNAIAYHMKVNNIMQIYLYDCATKNHTQVTFGPENKHEVSWSPDGTHLLFAKEHAGKSSIASLNLSTRKINQLTSNDDSCSYPHWSPRYKTFPTVIT